MCVCLAFISLMYKYYIMNILPNNDIQQLWTKQLMSICFYTFIILFSITLINYGTNTNYWLLSVQQIIDNNNSKTKNIYTIKLNIKKLILLNIINIIIIICIKLFRVFKFKQQYKNLK